MTTTFFETIAALAIMAIALLGPLHLLKKRRKRLQVARNVARRILHELRQEYIRGPLERRQKVPAKVAFLRRYCAENGLVLADAGTSDRELDQMLRIVDVKTPDGRSKTPVAAFIPLGETVLAAPEDACVTADEPPDRSGVRLSAAPRRGRVSSLPPGPHAASEVRAGLDELGDDGIDDFVEREFDRIIARR